MDKSKKLNQVSAQFGSLQNPNPPMKIDWMFTVAWHLFFERESLAGTCLVYLQVENRIGIADLNKKGYTKTPCVLYAGVHGQDAVSWFNKNILELTVEQSAEIILSTMRK